MVLSVHLHDQDTHFFFFLSSLPPSLPPSLPQVNKQTTLSEKDKKKEVKRIMKLISDGKKKKTISEDEILDLELKLEELKTAP